MNNFINFFASIFKAEQKETLYIEARYFMHLNLLVFNVPLLSTFFSINIQNISQKRFLYNNNHSPQSISIYSQHQREEAMH